jgi:glutathione synthase/RimK-type ligase-like ATP-grasp enzyme
MITTLIVVDSPNEFCQLDLHDCDVIDFDRYLSEFPKRDEGKIRVINLCATDRYLSKGYYCSLLAEARTHKVLPSVNIINDLIIESQEQSFQMKTVTLPKALSDEVQDGSHCDVFFGSTHAASMASIAKFALERFPAPFLSVSVSKQANATVMTVGFGDWQSAENNHKTDFAKALHDYMLKTWRRGSKRKQARWDMAILCNENEATPPSDVKAIKHFIKAAKLVGINAEVINSTQATNIGYYDALFIRETTAINHPTYHIVPSPRSHFVSDNEMPTCEKLAQDFGFPMVLKLPESSFSMGVFKVKDIQALRLKLEKMLNESALVLVQEYIFTEFDWRIGILNGRPIYACRYHMARGHWQIYNHDSQTNTTGGFETLPTFEVPKPVLDAAVKACSMIGKSLYGVDIKQANGKVYVIEVNDNPSIESKVEDLYLGKELYMIIMQEFANRLEARGR